jgi:hypothetical protein
VPCPSTNRVFPLSRAISSREFCTYVTLFSLSAGCCAPAHSPGAAGHRTFPPLNLHRARVRRNHGRLPSNGFIERAQSSVLVRSSSAKRASDKALAFIGTTYCKRLSSDFPLERGDLGATNMCSEFADTQSVPRSRRLNTPDRNRSGRNVSYEPLLFFSRRRRRDGIGCGSAPCSWLAETIRVFSMRESYLNQATNPG